MTTQFQNTRYIPPRYNPTYNIPDKQASGETVNKIFLNVASGKYFDIKKAIIEQKASLNLSDIQGKTVLHYILLNTNNISKTEKFDLIKSAIEMGAPIDQPDTEGIRPLHLASAQQNRKVIKLLLEKKAEVNSRDNNYMTPLHYAIIPDTSPCNAIHRVNILPDKKEDTDVRTNDLFEQVYLNFQNDPIIVGYISHIANIFANRFVYTNQDADKEKLSQIIKNILNDKDRAQQINDSYNEKLVGFKETIYKTVKTEKLSKTMSKIDFKENTQNGWGPSLNGVVNTNKKLQILPERNLSEAFSNMYETFRKVNLSRLDDLNKRRQLLKKNISNFVNYVSDVASIISMLTNYYNFIRINEGGLRQTMPNLDFLISSLETLFTDLLVNNIMIVNPNLANNNGFASIQINVSQRLLAKSPTQSNFILRDLQPPVKIGIGNIIDYYVMNINQLFNIIDNLIDGVMTNITNNMNMVAQYKTVSDLGDIQMYLLNVSYITLLLETYAGSLDNAINKFNDAIKDGKLKKPLTQLYTIFKTIDNMHTITRPVMKLSELQNMIYIDKGDAVVHTNNGLYVFSIKINNNYYLAVPRPVGDVRPAQYYIRDYNNNNVVSIDDIMNFTPFDTVDDIVEKINSFVKSGARDHNMNVYNIIHELQQQLNGVIDMHNAINGFIFIRKFNNDMDPNTSQRPNTNTFDHILYTSMKHLKILPDNYRDFHGMMEPIIFRNKTRGQTNATLFASKIINDYGYIMTTPENKLVIVDGSSQAPVQFTPGLLVGTFPRNASVLNQPNSLVRRGAPELKNIPEIINKNNTSEIFTVIGSVVDFHLYIIKLILIMYFIEKVTLIFHNGNNGIAIDQADTNVYIEMQDLFNDIETMSTDNSFGIMIAIIGSMVDDIIISTIDNISNISTSYYIKFLARNLKITNISTLLNTISGSKVTSLLTARRLIAKPINSSLKDKDMLLTVVSSAIKNLILNPTQIDVEVLQMFSNIGDTDPGDNKTTEQNRLINFDVIDSVNDICYNIDEDVVGDLLQSGADPNMSERTGKTPLMFAVYLQNNKIIDTLLRSGAKIGFNNSMSNINNDSGKNVYYFCFNQLLNNIEASPIFNIDSINQKVIDHLKKKTGVDKIYSNSNLILKITAYLFTHQLTSNANVYPNMWDRSHHVQILSMLGLGETNYDLIPLAKVDPDIIRNNVNGYITFNNTIDEYSSKLTKEREIYIRLENSINNLNSELVTLSANDGYRSEELRKFLRELNEQKIIVNANITSLIQEITALINIKNQSNNSAIVTQVDNQLKGSNVMHSLILANKNSRDVCNIYDVFFDKVINVNNNTDNGEYMMYTKMWNDLLIRPDREYEKDYTQMIGILQKYILNKGIVEPEIFLDAYSPICELYEKVLYKYGRDYLELSMYLGENGTSDYMYNYVLKQIFCIMVHVFKHTMSINFINTISQLFARQDKGRIRNKTAMNVYGALESSGFINYCINTMPKQIIKVVCKIAEREKDPAINTTVTDILNKALDLISLATYDGINKSNIDDAKELVVPFFTAYMEAYTAEIHFMMVKQLKMIMVQYKWLKIIKLLAEKAVLEKTA
jgi:ankyrin repeat protein